MIVDTHIHLDDHRYKEDLDVVIQRAVEGGVERFIIPGADPDTLKRAVEIAEQYPEVFFAIGVHPYDIEKFSQEDFLQYIKHQKCVAIGECGLDYFRLEGSDEEKELEKQKQKKIFIEQIMIAKKYNKPLIVHIRDASRDAKKILMESGAGEVGGVLHCYNADEELLSLSDEKFYFGVGGVVTFKNAKKLLNVLPKIPLEKLLIETDGPYLTPTPHRGERNEPFYCQLVVQKIAMILGKSVKEISTIATQNTHNLFDIKSR